MSISNHNNPQDDRYAPEIAHFESLRSPDVSVVMAVRDGARFVEQAIRSILVQTISNLELIVVDDGSADLTPEILDRFDDPRMRVVTQPTRGLAASLNRGVSLARAPLIARMDADDISEPNRLRAQLDFMISNPDVGLLGSATTVINESGERLRGWTPPLNDGDLRGSLLKANQFAHSSVMFRKELFRAVGGYANMPFAQDYDLWLRMAARSHLANLPSPLVQRREMSSGFGTAKETRQIRWAMRARLNAVRRGQYSPLALRHVLKPGAAAVMPGPVRELVRRSFGQRAA